MTEFLPNPDLPEITNAARMAKFASAAYWAVGNEFRDKRSTFSKEYQDGEITWWNLSNCSGVCVTYDRDIFIGIAGSNDAQGWRQNRDLEPRNLEEWGDVHGIKLSPGVGDTTTSFGFAVHARLAYRGLVFAELEGRRVWIGAHSLGGAVANILQATDRFSHARAYTYGAPRAFRGRVPMAKRAAVKYALDPIVHVPRSYYPPKQPTFYVRYPGSVTTRRTVRFTVLSYLGALRAILQRGSISWAIEAARKNHSMRKYELSLESLR